MNQNIFMFVQENQLTNYSKEGGDRMFVTPLYIGSLHKSGQRVFYGGPSKQKPTPIFVLVD
jgi:hypothetical protein